MKKLLPWFLVVGLLLSGCDLMSGLAPAGDPTLTEAQMQTEVAAILTSYPQATPKQFFQPTAPPLAAPTYAAPPTAQVIIVTPTMPPTDVPLDTSTPLAGPPTPTLTRTPTLPPTMTFTPTSGPTLTPPLNDPRNRMGVEALIDTMDDANHWGWYVGSYMDTNVAFSGGYMVFTGLNTRAAWRLPALNAATNMYVEATFRTGQCQGDDEYGIIFAVPVLAEADQGYIFGVTCDGNYRLTAWDGKQGPFGIGTPMIDTRQSKPNPKINAGGDQINRLGVMTVYEKGANHIYLYSNGFMLNEGKTVTDNTFRGGHFGVMVAARRTTGFTVYIDEIRYWVGNPRP